MWRGGSEGTALLDADTEVDEKLPWKQTQAKGWVAGLEGCECGGGKANASLL